MMDSNGMSAQKNSRHEEIAKKTKNYEVRL